MFGSTASEPFQQAGVATPMKEVRAFRRRLRSFAEMHFFVHVFNWSIAIYTLKTANLAQLTGPLALSMKWRWR
jgi:hypothetical protein